MTASKDTTLVNTNYSMGAIHQLQRVQEYLECNLPGFWSKLGDFSKAEGLKLSYSVPTGVLQTYQCFLIHLGSDTKRYVN